MKFQIIEKSRAIFAAVLLLLNASWAQAYSYSLPEHTHKHRHVDAQQHKLNFSFFLGFLAMSSCEIIVLCLSVFPLPKNYTCTNSDFLNTKWKTFHLRFQTAILHICTMAMVLSAWVDGWMRGLLHVSSTITEN